MTKTNKSDPKMHKMIDIDNHIVHHRYTVFIHLKINFKCYTRYKNTRSSLIFFGLKVLILFPTALKKITL